MINDTEKKNNNKRRNTAILLGACVFALVFGAFAQIATTSDDPLAEQSHSTTSQTPALDTIPMEVEKTTEYAGWTPDEFASVADAIFEEQSSIADAAFDANDEPTTQAVAVDGKPVDGAVRPPKEYLLPGSTQIVKDFSMGIPVFSDTMNDWRTHNGVDFGGNEGDPVLAVADAVVTDVYEDVSWGGVVELDFGGGVTARYCGLQHDSIEAAVGDQVKQGDILGVLGSVPVESEDGCHLHYEMRVDGAVADPLEVLGRGGEDE